MRLERHRLFYFVLREAAPVVVGKLDLLEFFTSTTGRPDSVVRPQFGVQVDALYSQVFRDLLEHALGDNRTRSTGLILLARSLERIADHATNVCEEVFYLVEGADIRHQPTANT